MKNNQFKTDIFFDIREFEYKELFDGVEYVWDALTKINSFIKDQSKGEHKSSYKNIADVFVGKGAVIEDTAVIKGPCIVGENSYIGPAAFIRENCLIGNNVHIGHGVEVKSSIILNEAHIAHLNYVGDSIIGNKVNIGAGAILANFRFDGKTIMIRFNEESIDTRLSKFGAIVGDGCKIGVNSVLNPGTILGKNSIVYPLVSVKGVFGEGAIIK